MPELKQPQATISRQSMQRMPYYVKCLTEMSRQRVSLVSAPMLASQLKLNEVQVRKDLAAVSRVKGKPKAGFVVDDLLSDMKDYLGYNCIDNAILIGAGSIGRALMAYRGFDEYGLNIVAAFDNDPTLVGTMIAGKTIYALSELPKVVKGEHVRIGVITVPAEHAQAACDLMVAGGILAVWNFAPTHLNAPDDILIQNENMAASLAILSKHLHQRLDQNQQGK